MPPSHASAETSPRWLRATAIALTLLALVAAARGLVRHNTWYLASDQFAFLTFAADLRAGRVFHDPATIELMRGPSLPRESRADAYYQTYILDGGRLYSRYPPGFPLLLAATDVVAGDAGVHGLNPLLYLGLLVVLAAIAMRLAPPPTGPAVAAATVWAMLVVPVEVHYWGITIARDLPAHLLGLIAVLLALGDAPGRAALALGLAASVRPDAVLWGLPVAAVLGRRAFDRRHALAGALAFLVGALPLFAYNTITLGHPLAFTQGGEFRNLLDPHAVMASVLGAGPTFTSGGAFRFSHFPDTFVVHVRYLAATLGGFLVIAIATLVVATLRGERLARALGPYAVAGLLFFSCWSHGDPRYLVGVSICLLLLAALGCVALARGAASDVRGRRLALVVAAGLVAASLLLPRDPLRGLARLEQAMAAALVVATVAGTLGPRGRRVALLLPAVALAAFGAARILASGGGRDAFQAEQVAKARATVEATLPKGALVLVSSTLGRPAENLTHYTHVDAHYLTELGRLFSDADLVTYRCTEAGRPLYLLLAPGEPIPFHSPRAWQRVREVARRQGDALRDWFVDPARAFDGAVLYEAKIGLNLPDP